MRVGSSASSMLRYKFGGGLGRTGRWRRARLQWLISAAMQGDQTETTLLETEATHEENVWSLSSENGLARKWRIGLGRAAFTVMLRDVAHIVVCPGYGGTFCLVPSIPIVSHCHDPEHDLGSPLYKRVSPRKRQRKRRQHAQRKERAHRRRTRLGMACQAAEGCVRSII